MLDPLKNAISSWEQSHASQHYREFQLILSRWADVVGEEVASHAQPISLQGQVLRVATSSSTWSQTLMFERTRIVAKLNAMLSLNLTDMRFQPGKVDATAAKSPEEAAMSKVQAEVRSHPSWVASSPATPPPQPPTTPKEAFDRWSKRMIQRSSALADCPRCHCPTPPGELERWTVCSFCVSHDWHEQTAAKTARGGVPPAPGEPSGPTGPRAIESGPSQPISPPPDRSPDRSPDR